MMKQKISVVVLLFLSAYSFASVPVQGTLQATDACPAYLSKNHKTNPDNYHLMVNEIYDLVETNKATQADWYRININQQPNTLRWVHAECGNINTSDDLPAKHCNKEPGHADSYVLALSWQPAFCETYGYERGKAECRTLTSESYTATHLALHGFWPNQSACGINYGYCQVEEQKHHCDYPAIPFTDFVARELAVVMPSYAEGSCLERHEWNRHGTCQLLNTNDYFDTATQLTQQFDQTQLANLLRKFNGGYVPLASLKQAFIDDFGSGALKKLYLGCQQGMLVDIWISLPANATLSQPIQKMVQQAPSISRQTRCPQNIYVSDFFT